MLDVCIDLSNRKEFTNLSCVISGFKRWIEGQKLAFPVDESKFDELIATYSITRNIINGNKLGFIDGKLKFIRISFQY